MAHFPVYMDLRDKPVLIVGNTPQARQKASLLAPFQPKIRFLSRLTPEDFSPAPALVILTGPEREEAAGLCRERNIPVNSVDDPANCTFFFPSLIVREDCVIAISSGGTAPAASAALRRQIEDTLPENLEEILPWLSGLTAQLRQTIADSSRRGEILARASTEAFQKKRPLTGDELDACM